MRYSIFIVPRLAFFPDNITIISHYNQEEIVMGMMKEFKEFAVKGNVIDMAVGIIIGAAFG